MLLLRGCGGWRKVLRWVVCLLLRVCDKSDATAQLRRQLSVWRYLFAILRAPRRRNELQKPSCGLCLLVSLGTLALCSFDCRARVSGPARSTRVALVWRLVLAAREEVKTPRLASLQVVGFAT